MFLEGDSIGDWEPRACSNCKRCTTCTFTGQAISQKDRLELDYIEQGLSQFKGFKSFSVKHPFLQDLKTALTDNRSQAIAYGLSLEKTLSRASFKQRLASS